MISIKRHIHGKSFYAERTPQLPFSAHKKQVEKIMASVGEMGGLMEGDDRDIYTVEPHLSEPHGRHTIRPDNRGVRIDEGNRNSRSMGYRVGDN